MTPIYGTNGNVVGWLKGSDIYNLNGSHAAALNGHDVHDHHGSHLGVLKDGFFRDHRGAAVAFLVGTSGGPLTPILAIPPSRRYPPSRPSRLYRQFRR